VKSSRNNLSAASQIFNTLQRPNET